MNYNDYPHRRYNPLTESWVLVSPHRSKRPWQGQVEKLPADNRPAYDPGCYLCAGNVRANGAKNPDYSSVYVFDNDFAALLPDAQPVEAPTNDHAFFIAKPERGMARVICFSPRHDLTIADMSTPEIRQVVDAWVAEYKSLQALPFVNYVQIFENKGAIMGCSNPHPHGQIWAQESIPDEPLKKQHAQLKYWEKHQHTLLSDYLREEQNAGERILFENEHMIALVPYWAVWPFEAMIVPRRAMPRITDMTDDEKDALADAYRQLAAAYDRLFDTSFPYSAGIHQAPTDGDAHLEWHWHFVFYPPLLRSATVKKFMVGYEMLANPQRDITPEMAADMLRSRL
ncbi:MAG: UDP-glucose--hexose-1-phosphate uridylyltransferase [Saprospiraceae bacterium]|nr:UDP-glucose--hexose-1-phosphate uridylyltransferase [Saprospiraceae bacterium]